MKALIFLLLAGLPPVFAAAQLTDDFSDGNFTEAPGWSGDREKFVVTGGQLLLNDADPGSQNTSQLRVLAPTALNDTTYWEFFLRLDFAPSSSNFARVYLSAERPDLNAPQPAYFLRFGGISGDQDALELYRQDGGQSRLILAGAAGSLGQAPARARVRVRRTPGGRWSLSADYSGGTDFTEEGSVLDSTYDMGRYFGLLYSYTSTRADRFIFDDLRIDPLFEDTQPPRLQSATALSDTLVLVQFDEPLDSASGAETANYRIEPDLGQPARANSAALSGRIELRPSQPLLSGVEYRLTVENVRDLAGNAAALQSATFTYFDVQPAAAGDILITEFLPDPTPSLGVLPEAEYVELFNRSDKIIELSTLAFGTGASPDDLPERLFFPGEYLILCDREFAEDFAAFGPVAPLESLPAITNSGDRLQLTRADGAELLVLDFRSDWYREADKAEGGFALELADPGRPANCPKNWLGSTDAAGGTPGKSNAASPAEVDSSTPALTSATPLGGAELNLTFDTPLDTASALDPQWFSLTPSLSVGGVLAAGNNDQLILLLDSPLDPGTIYDLRIAPGLSDCLGNTLAEPQTLSFGLPEPIAPRDIVINELLFNPQTGGEDFVELFNRSEKILNLRDLQLINTQNEGSNNRKAVEDDLLLLPGELLVLTESPADILERYAAPRPDALITNDLPTLEDQAGNLTLRWAGLTIDSFDYSEALHLPLLEDEDGVSLERIDPEAPSQSADSWHSAAAAAGFATPTGPNSQRTDLSSPVTDLFELPNPRFSPNGDGFEDFLVIRYQVDQPGYLLNLRVFDALGRPVKTLLRNELLAATGSFQWDGATDEGERARVGVYVLWFELFDPEGGVVRHKESCVLAGALD